MSPVMHRYARSAVCGGLIAAGAFALAAGVEIATYPRWRAWCLHWGMTESEAARDLPGDELLPDPWTVSTRAVYVGAPPTDIWPWLVQMGPGRGGAYTYDWIENLLGLGMHSADHILPQYQHLEVGDAWRLGRRGPVLRVAEVGPYRSLVLRSDDGNWVWAFCLAPSGRRTRLISRNRIAATSASWFGRAVSSYLMEPGSLIMERKMLLGLKERAERPGKTPG